MAASSSPDASPPDASPPDASPALQSLFSSIEESFSRTSLGPERWYLVVLASIVGGGEPDAAASLYLHLVSQADRQSAASRQALVRRLRETLVKCAALYGVCKPIEAMLAISGVERAADKERTCTRAAWRSGAANVERGRAWLRRVYQRDLDGTLDLFRDHPDFAWLSEEITYGLYLSDRQVLDDFDTEVVVLAAIMVQNLPKETWWHIRGCRRVGISRGDVQVVWESIKSVADYLGLPLNRVPKPEEVEHDV